MSFPIYSDRINETYEEKIMRWIDNGAEKFIFISENKPAFVIPITKNIDIEIIEMTEDDDDDYGDIITINDNFSAYRIRKTIFLMNEDTHKFGIEIHCEHTQPYFIKN